MEMQLSYGAMTTILTMRSTDGTALLSDELSSV